MQTMHAAIQDSSVTPTAGLPLLARGHVAGEVIFEEATVRGGEVDGWINRSTI